MNTEYDELQQAFFGNLKDAGNELLQTYIKYDLNQAQAACAAAWALNQMSSVEGHFPKVATISLDYAVQNKSSVKRSDI